MGKLTAAEIAARLGVEVSTVTRWAMKENWSGVEALVNGVPVSHYLVAKLPERRKQALAGPESGTDLVAAPGTSLAVVKNDLPEYSSLKGWQKRVMDARLALFREFERLESEHGTSRAIDLFITRARLGHLPQSLLCLVPVANARSGREGSRTISKSTIYRWKDMNGQGLTAFAPRGVEKTGIPAWAPYFIDCYQKPQKPTIPEAMDAMRKILPAGMAMPSYSQVMRFNAKRSRLDRQRGRKSGTELQAHRGCRQRDTSELLPFDVGVCDGHSFKARVAHPTHGRPFHPEVCAVVDAATRVVTGWSAGLAESAQTVADAVRHAATVNETKKYGGVFGILYTDGGSGNAAKVNTDELIGRFPRLGTIWEKGIPGNAQGHGLIEVINKSMWIRAAKQFATFTGKDMDKLAARKVYLLVNKDIKEKGTSELLPTWPQFLEHCRQEVEAYNRRPHTALPMITDDQRRRRHMSPLEMLAWHISRGWQPESVAFDQRDIEMLFAPRAEATVRRGTVTLWKNVYYNKILEHYDGMLVQIAYDIHDAERVRIYDAEDRLICHAEFEKNKSSYFPMPLVEQGREQRARRRSQLHLDQLAEIEMERRGVLDLTPRHAAAVIDIATKQRMHADREELQAEMAREDAAPEMEIPRDDRGKYRCWRELDAKLAGGGTLSARELRFYEAFRTTRAYQAFAMVAEDLGSAQQQ